MSNQIWTTESMADEDVRCSVCRKSAIGYSRAAGAGVWSVCAKHIRDGKLQTRREMNLEMSLHNLSNAVRRFDAGELEQAQLIAHARQEAPGLWEQFG